MSQLGLLVAKGSHALQSVELLEKRIWYKPLVASPPK